MLNKRPKKSIKTEYKSFTRENLDLNSVSRLPKFLNPIKTFETDSFESTIRHEKNSIFW